MKFRFGILDCLLVAMIFGPIVINVGDRTPKLFWSDLVIIIYLLAISKKICVQKGYYFLYFHSDTKWFLFLSLLVITTILQSENILKSMDIAKLYVMPFVVFIIAYNEIKSNNDVHHINILMVIVSLYFGVSSLYNWVNFYSGFSVLESNLDAKDMIQTVTGRSNTVAGINALLLPMSLVLVLNKNKYLKMLGICSIITLVTSILFAMSRASILALFVGFIIWIGLETIFKRNNKINVKFAIPLIISSLTAMIAWYSFPDELQDRFLRTYEQTKYIIFYDISSDSRWTSWKSIITYIVKYPMGIGVGNYQNIILTWNPDIIGTAHNFYLDIAIEMGVLGFFLLIKILYNYGKVLVRLPRIVKFSVNNNLPECLITSYIIFLVNVFFEPNYYSPTFMYMFSVMMAMAYALYRFNSCKKLNSTKVLKM